MVRAPRLRGDRVEVIRERGALRGGEEIVRQRELFRPSPVVGKVLRSSHLRVGVELARLVAREVVHPPLVPRLERALVAMRDVVGQAVGRTREGPEVVAVVSLGDAVHAGEPPEHVIRRPVLLDHEHDVLDRPSCVERGCVGALGSSRREQIGRVAGNRRILTRRRQDDEAHQRCHPAEESHRSVMLRDGLFQPCHVAGASTRGRHALGRWYDDRPDRSLRKGPLTCHGSHTSGRTSLRDREGTRASPPGERPRPRRPLRGRRRSDADPRQRARPAARLPRDGPGERPRRSEARRSGVPDDRA